MCKKRKIICDNFQEFMRNVRSADEKLIRDEIISSCRISRRAYYNWLNLVNEPRKGNMEVINSIAVRFGYKKIF